MYRIYLHITNRIHTSITSSIIYENRNTYNYYFQHSTNIFFN